MNSKQIILDLKKERDELESRQSKISRIINELESLDSPQSRGDDAWETKKVSGLSKASIQSERNASYKPQTLGDIKKHRASKQKYSQEVIKFIERESKFYAKEKIIAELKNRFSINISVPNFKFLLHKHRIKCQRSKRSNSIENDCQGCGSAKGTAFSHGKTYCQECFSNLKGKKKIDKGVGKVALGRTFSEKIKPSVRIGVVEETKEKNEEIEEVSPSEINNFFGENDD